MKTQRSPVGPKSLKWCEENIPHFDEMSEITRRVQAESQASRDKIEKQP